VYDQVEHVLDRVRPNLRLDGADVVLQEVTTEGVVCLRFTGGLCGCPMSQLALLMGIEATLKKEIPEVRSVNAVRA
jgi:Fe-S cluster biogenesis protein NfuA